VGTKIQEVEDIKGVEEFFILAKEKKQGDDKKGAEVQSEEGHGTYWKTEQDKSRGSGATFLHILGLGEDRERVFAIGKKRTRGMDLGLSVQDSSVSVKSKGFAREFSTEEVED